ncbi:MAG: ABC transporter permease [Anaerolineae bacterium]|nr:ABC transporter permease [Anaerolineae bacterium]
MREIWIVARHEYLVNVRRLGFILMTLLLPALGLLGLVVAAFAGGQAGAFLERQFAPQLQAIGVVDHSGLFTPILPEYADRFRLFATEEEGRAALQAREVSVLLVFPADYVASGQVQVVGRGNAFDAAVLEDSDRVRGFFVAHLLRDRVDPALRARVEEPLKPVFVGLEGGPAGEGGMLGTMLNVMVPYSLSILLIVTIFTSSGYLLRGVAEEKSSRVIEIVLSSVPATQLLAGKVIGLGAVGLTQVAVWLLSGVALSGGAAGLLGVVIPLLTRADILVLAVVYYLLGFLVYAVLMGSVGALGTTMQESQQLAGIFSMLAAVPMMVSGFLFANPNMPIARVLSWFPLTAPTMMMIRLPLADVPTVDIVGSVVLLVLSVPGVLWVGAKVFRMGLLMYGKRPSLSQVWRALREA